MHWSSVAPFVPLATTRASAHYEKELKGEEWGRKGRDNEKEKKLNK
jgi:hypothetical protein